MTVEKLKNWKLIRPGKPEFYLRDKCMCHTGAGHCPNAAEECIKHEGSFLSMCHECRVLSFGLTPPEKAARTKAFNRSQVPMFPGFDGKVTA